MPTVLAAYMTPLLIYPLVPLAALLFLIGPNSRPTIIGIMVLMLLFFAAISYQMSSSTRNALVKGVLVDADVLTVGPGYRGGVRGRLRVDSSDRHFETDYAYARPKLQPGDRMRVLIDPVKDAVLFNLGPVAA
jgi:hypothetical protein